MGEQTKEKDKEEKDKLFYKNFYDYCKNVFSKCCDIEKESFFPDYFGELDNIQQKDIHHENLSKDFFQKKINEVINFDKLDKAQQKLVLDIGLKKTIEINLEDLFMKIKENLPKTSSFYKYTSSKYGSEEYKVLLDDISIGMYAQQFVQTNKHIQDDTQSKRETGIELPAYSFTIRQRARLATMDCIKLYDAYEFLRELKYFEETPEHKKFFVKYISYLHKNYNKRGSENKREAEPRSALKRKLNNEILALPLNFEAKNKCYDYIDDNNYDALRRFLLIDQKWDDHLDKLYCKLLGLAPLDDTIQYKEDRTFENDDVDKLDKQRLINKYIVYVKPNAPKNKTLDMVKVKEIHIKVIKSLFSEEDDFTCKETKLRKEIRENLSKDYEKYPDELNYVLPPKTNHNQINERILKPWKKNLDDNKDNNKNHKSEIETLMDIISKRQKSLSR